MGLKYILSWYTSLEVIPMEKVKTSVSLDEDVYKYIQSIAERERLNVSQVINKEFAIKMEQEKGS
jgi:predicted DNA-binding ribbon-helix-helix protein